MITIKHISDKDELSFDDLLEDIRTHYEKNGTE
jgi:hypothetical protein